MAASIRYKPATRVGGASGAITLKSREAKHSALGVSCQETLPGGGELVGYREDRGKT